MKYINRSKEYGIDIDPLRMIYHAVDSEIREHDPKLQFILTTANLAPEHFSALSQTKLRYLALGGKLRRFTTLYGKDDETTIPKPATYNLSQYLSSIADLIDTQLGQHINGQVTFKTKLDNNSSASFDADMVSTILFNLVDNALRHGGTSNKNVYISLTEDAKSYIISVKDKGRGMPDKVLNSFVTGEPVLPDLATVYPSRMEGLGLLLCHKYSRLLHGTLTIENQKVGTKVNLHLPKNPPYEYKTLQEPQSYYPDKTTLLLFMATTLLTPSLLCGNDTLIEN